MNYNNIDLQDTIIALATPPGIGAISIVRLSGTHAIDLCNGLFKGGDLTQAKSHTLHYGHLVEAGKTIDEVMIALMRSPRSFTTEDSIEINCHGSPYISQKIIEAFIRAGARLAKPGEFSLRAFLNGRIDLSQAEAVADLIASTSESSHQLALQQMRGGFSNQISQLREQLIHFASMVELELDFGEEDVEFADRQQLTNLVDQIQGVLKPLMESFLLGNVIKNGVATVIAGRPNAGKSTLLNAILNEERAIVSNIAGTTRDTIEERINIRGIDFRLIDTAGIRDAQDQIEAIGVRKTMEEITRASILVYVFDVGDLSLTTVQEDLHKLVSGDLPYLIIANKTDLLTETALQNLQTQGQTLYADHFISIQAKDGNGVHLVKERLYQLVLSGQLTLETTIVSNARHYEALQKAAQALQQVANGIEIGISGELLAFDIRESLYYLGTITGEVTSDDLLANIFSNFCIGK